MDQLVESFLYKDEGSCLVPNAHMRARPRDIHLQSQYWEEEAGGFFAHTAQQSSQIGQL